MGHNAHHCDEFYPHPSSLQKPIIYLYTTIYLNSIYLDTVHCVPKNVLWWQKECVAQRWVTFIAETTDDCMFFFRCGITACTTSTTYPVTFDLNKGRVIITLRPGRNGRHFDDGIFQGIFLNKNEDEDFEFVYKGPLNNIPELVQIMAWRRPGDKPLSEPRMSTLLTEKSPQLCFTDAC